MDICLIYFSSSVEPFKDLVKLIQHSRIRNAEAGVTSLLLYVRGQIIQVLEGDKQVVEELYKRIEQDIRHTNVSLAINRPISQRLFAQWSMGYETINQQQLEEIKAIVNLERHTGSMLVLSEDPILRTFQVFYDGNRHN